MPIQRGGSERSTTFDHIFKAVPPSRSPHSDWTWRRRFSVATVITTVLLLSWGGVVTSIGAGMAFPDWPTSLGSYNLLNPVEGWWQVPAYLAEHGHRLIASLVGLLTVILAAWTWWEDPRAWMRKLGLGAVALVVAAGVWSRELDGLTPDAVPPIRPVKGQMIQMRRKRPFDLQHVVRGPEAYLAPKSDGRVVMGATSEEMGFDTTVTAGGLYDLLEGGWEVVPGIRDLPVDETWAGLRPATRDHAPLLGATAAPGVIMATGHYRHGILLTPITAEEIARLVRSGETSDWLQPFSPLRFLDAGSPTYSA